MGVQLFLNEFNYRDGTIHQNRAPSRAPKSSVAAEKQFGASRSPSACLLSHAPSQKASRIYVCEPGDDRSSELGAPWRRIQLGCGAKRLDGSTAKSNFFIFYAIQTDLVQLSLSVALSSEQRRVVQWHFPSRISEKMQTSSAVAVAKASSTLCVYFLGWWLLILTQIQLPN